MPNPFIVAIDQIEVVDVQTLIGRPKSLQVEFKETLPGRDGRPDPWLDRADDVGRYAKERLFKAIVAFANTSGGHLILGIAENKDKKPASAKAIAPIVRCADLAERLERAAQAIDPPVPLLGFGPSS